MAASRAAIIVAITAMNCGIGEITTNIPLSEHGSFNFMVSEYPDTTGDIAGTISGSYSGTNPTNYSGSGEIVVTGLSSALYPAFSVDGPLTFDFDAIVDSAGEIVTFSFVIDGSFIINDVTRSPFDICSSLTITNEEYTISGAADGYTFNDGPFSIYASN